MKTINPFKRLNKEDFIPCSLFPASKVCDTSMDIGRATPLYCLDMVAGNRVSLDLSQLTRFQPMIAPVMTNYSIEYGAFFVPYVAFDEFFQSTWFRTHCQNTDVQRKAVLRAREFFNPAIDNSEKVHPWMFSTQRCGSKVNWVGSLYDHLRAPLGLPDWSVDKIYSSNGAIADDSSEVNAWLESRISSVDTTSMDVKVKNIFTDSIYGFGILQLPDVASGTGVLSPLQILCNHPEFVDSSVRANFISWLNTGEYVNTEDLDIHGTPSALASQPNDFGPCYLNNELSLQTQLVSSLAAIGVGLFDSGSRYGSPCSWSPYLADGTTVVDVNALVSQIYYQWTGTRPNGTFTVSDGVLSYSAASVKQTVLASLFENSLYSQAMILATEAAGSDFADTICRISLDPTLTPQFDGFLIWVVNNYHLLDNDPSQLKVNSAADKAAVLQSLLAATDNKQFVRVYASLLYYLYGVDSLPYRSSVFSDYISWSDMFGKSTIAQVQGAYRSFVESAWITKNRNLQWNSVYWLAYQRIFADWFLNEHYTKHEDYLDLVGAAYIAGAQSLVNGDGKTMTDWFTAGNLSDGNNPKLLDDSTLSYFADRIAAGQCMPVLWSLDCVTNLRQSTSTSSTPIGQSITENFYNRFYARFKDLINRMGPDYRRNARALYGKGPDDASLLRSQVVGYKSFDMQIGDVAQNSETTKDSVLGQFAGYAVSRNRAGSFDWTAQESGVFVVLAWVRPKYTCFADLVPRSLYKSEYMDYLIPQFGGVGYQDFAYKQLNPTDPNGNSRLGFEERYSEYMMMDNECSGLMRTSMAYYNSNRIGTPCYTPNTADFYHLLYMDEESDLKRVFVDNFNDPVLVSAYFNGNVTRQLPATIKTEF